MAPSKTQTPADRTVLSADALEKLDAIGGEKPPTFNGVDAATYDDATEHGAIYRPERHDGESSLQADVQDAFEDAYNKDTPTGSLTDRTRPGAAYFHTEWLEKYEAAEAIAAMPEMPEFDFYPAQVAEQVRSLAQNALVAIAREVVDDESVPAIYVWWSNPAETHLFAHATQNSQSLYFDVSDAYPLVDESGPVGCDHVLAVPRQWSVSRVLFIRPH